MKKLLRGANELQALSWSLGHMTFEEVQLLLGSLRGYSKHSRRKL
jgi:hypothetical protein